MSDWDDLVDTMAPDTEPERPEAADIPSLALEFTGSGSEYFRIWIVNLLLTVATLGIYSAWAKTRRLQYFYRNTRLAGASFDFRGDPRAILRGRLLAVLVLAAYHYAFGFSLRAGIVTVALLLAGLPFMMRSALRFRLGNTWYRGLPFGFDGGVGAAYLVYLPPVALFVLPGTVVALMHGTPLASLSFLLYLAWPLIHGAMKRYQHGHLMYGDQHVSFPLSALRLARPYLMAVLAGLGLLLLAGFGMAMLFGVAKPNSFTAGVAVLLSGAVLAYLIFVLSGPLITVRVNNLAWSATAFPGVRISCQMRTRSYLRLQTVNVFLTLLTLGLFRPYAAVRTWRYRVEHVTVETPDGFDRASLMAAPRSMPAAGDGVADFLDVDLSW